MPLVSVIMPTFNSATFVVESVASVLAQTFADWELLIVDDASSDDTVNVLRSIPDDRIKIFVLKANAGPAAARNAAIRQAQGRYIAFLDADDIWLPMKLERQLGFMRQRGASFSYTSYEKIDESGAVIGRRDVPPWTTYNRLLADNVIGCLTAMYDRQQCGRVEMPPIRKRQDLGLWLRLAAKCDRIYGLQEVHAQYRIRRDSISANKFIAAQYTWKLYYEVEKIPLPKAIWYFSRYAVGGLLKH